MTTAETPSSVGFLSTVWQRKWMVLIPLAVSLATTYVVSRYYLDERYESSVSILVVPQRVPEQYVRSSVTQSVNERLNTISQTILSRTRLERIIKDLDLYPKERQTGLMEDIVQRMAVQDTKIEPLPGNAFRVSFTYGEPHLAQRVAEKIASLYIEESTRDREVLADGTDQFLAAQVEDAANIVTEHEKDIAKFRRANPGQPVPRVLTLQQEVLEDSYRALIMKKEESRIAANLERRQVGEQFRIVDPARIPETPVTRSVVRINFLGGLAGLSVGLVLAFVSGLRGRARD